MNEKPYSGAVSSDSGKSRMQVYREQLKEKRVASELDLNLMLMRSTRSQKVGRRGVHLTVAGEKIDYYNDDLILNYLENQFTVDMTRKIFRKSEFMTLMITT